MNKVHGALSVRKQCMLLSLNRSVVYYKKHRRLDDTDLANEIRDIWVKSPFYGYRRVTAVLKRLGYLVNRKRISSLMRKLGIRAIYPGPNLSKRALKHRIYPYLLRGLKIERPNQVWATDITYIRMGNGIGFVYLIALIDIYSRYIVSWGLFTTLEAANCIEVLERGLKQAKPEILNTDQGCQFTHEGWIAMLTANGIQISMDGKGRCIDNIYIERFWRSVKYEEVYLKSYETVPEGREAIGEYIDKLYNTERPHQSLKYKTPAEAYFAKF